MISAVYLISQSRSGSDAAAFTYRVPDAEIGPLLGRRIEPRVDQDDPIPLVASNPSVATFADLYPGSAINPKYWNEPEWAGSDSYGGPSIPPDFTPISADSILWDVDPLSVASRMRIPSISVDATVSELGIVDLGESTEYETPDKVIGHIPETSNPGQQGSGWFFAHLESFAAGEGNIFRRLPEVTELIKQDPVDVYVETDAAEYIYRVTQTSQINEKDLKLSSSNDAQITLVTCWPPRVYDQRILVDATLIAYKRG